MSIGKFDDRILGMFSAIHEGVLEGKLGMVMGTAPDGKEVPLLVFISNQTPEKAEVAILGPLLGKADYGFNGPTAVGFSDMISSKLQITNGDDLEITSTPKEKYTIN